ncbi:MAG: hypothetical protein KGS61_06585, partial [Verrucomicrobia bacterium]|nr:hypothetical protein [Verrucomicrobiota bacterium]
GALERVVRVLLALGWHPRHIAGLLRSKYERDFDWRDRWQGRDPALRADFCVRVLAGQCVVGHDDLLDLDCLSSREQRLCFQEDCGADLAQFRRSLLDRRACERLASRPFNRLFRRP